MLYNDNRAGCVIALVINVLGFKLRICYLVKYFRFRRATWWQRSGACL